MSASYCNLAKRETKVSAEIELAARGKGDLLAFARHRCPSPKVHSRLEALTAARYLDSLRANPVTSVWGASLLVKNSSTAGFRPGDSLHSPDFSPGDQSLGSSIVTMM
jgi:hypothetical protein